MFRNLKITPRQLTFSILTDVGLCECTLRRHDRDTKFREKLIVDKEYVLGIAYDYTDLAHQEGHRRNGIFLNEVCRYNNWILWDF